MSNIEIQSLIQRSNIESNKQYQRLAEKTQVMMPQNGQYEVIKNRLTHSDEVATSSKMMSAVIAERLNVNPSDIDYQFSVENVSKLHDLGHPCFGHDGSKFLDRFFKNLGVKEGFNDNNNNITVIEANNILVSDYVMASIIKYPDQLYDEQKEKYLPILNLAIQKDKVHYSSLGINLENQTRTIACQIMDEADRNSYSTSDLSDFLCLGNSINIHKLHRMAKDDKIDYRYSELSILSDIILSGSKTSIKAYFNDLKNRFNFNYTLTSKGLTVVDHNLEEYREFLVKLCFEFYIKPIRHNEFHKKNMGLFKKYVDDVISGKYSPSKYYTKKIQESKNDVEKYTYMRDMIAEVSDWYILNYHKIE